MKADLHFHPSFFSRGDISHITERTTPSLAEIEKQAVKTGLDLLTITSCSWAEHIDKRWETYMQEIASTSKQIPNQFLCPQAIRFTAKTLQGDYLIYLIHGQELQTNKGDLNVLFADKRVPIEKTKGDFYETIQAAKDSGDNILIGVNQLSNCHIPLMEMSELHEHGKIDFVESWNSMDFEKNNKYAQRFETETIIPGIAVSDGHRLEDMANACIITDEPYHLTIGTYQELAKLVKWKLETKGYINIGGKTPLKGKALYLARLANAIICPKY